MDALALLCNLYGDGPATLNRLKSAGLGTVDSLETIEPLGLAETLETTEAAARRFLREARLLGERMVEGAFDDEVRSPMASNLGREVLIDYEDDPDADFDQDDEVAEDQGFDDDEDEDFEDDDEEEDDDYEPDYDDDESEYDSLVDDVLNTWRERDIVTRAEWSDDRPLEVEVGEEPSSLDRRSTPLEVRLLDGLDTAWCRRLREAGIETVEALAAAQTLPLSRRMGVGLTVLERFTFLARRHLAALDLPAEPARTLLPRAPLPRRAPAPRAPEPVGAGAKFSLSEAPFGVATSTLARDLDRAARVPREREGTGGPFG